MNEQAATPAQEELDSAVRRRAVLIILGLISVAVVTPALFVDALWGGQLAHTFTLDGWPLLIGYFLGAIACGAATLWRGLDRLIRDLRSRPDTEHEQILIRIVFPSIVFDYSLAALTFSHGDPGDAA